MNTVRARKKNKKGNNSEKEMENRTDWPKKMTYRVRWHTTGAGAKKRRFADKATKRKKHDCKQTKEKSRGKKDIKRVI